MADQTNLQAQEPTVDVARSQSVQETTSDVSAHFGLLSWLVRGAYLVPPWWSEARDAELRNFWKRSDHLAGAIFTMVSKMNSIPFRIVSSDPANPRWTRQAEERHETLMYNAEFGAGWHSFYSKFLEDLLTQDNGAFAEIIGPGDPAGPITGAPTTIAHLDAARCTLTGHTKYPVVYTADDGKEYKLHYSRVIHVSQMTSPIKEMNGVGFSAVSRCINVAQNLTDILIYKQEKLGSRPHRAIAITQGGLDPDDLEAAFTIADAKSNAQGLSRHSKVVVVGERNIPEADLQLKELSGLPDGFDEQTSLMMGMATVALAFGVDARELFPAMGGGATRADAVLSHLKQRGKGPGQIIQAVESVLNYKFLPKHLKIEFEYQDDAEDRQAAEIQAVRSQRRERDIRGKISTQRVERMHMVKNGEITQYQFEDMELEDKRLPDGRDILVLLYDEGFSKYLSFTMDNPDDTAANDWDTILPEITKNRTIIRKDLAKVTNQTEKQRLQWSLATLNALVDEYTGAMAAEANAEAMALGEAAGAPMRGDRMRKRDPADPNQTQGTQSGDDLQPDKTDDNPNVKEVLLEKQIEDSLARIDSMLASEEEYRNLTVEDLMSAAGFNGFPAGTLEYEGQTIPYSPMGDQRSKGPMFRKGKKVSNGMELELPVMNLGPTIRPVIHLQMPQQNINHHHFVQQPEVQVNVPLGDLKEVVTKAMDSGEVDRQQLRDTLKALIVELEKRKETPVVVNVPKSETPNITINPVLEMPDTEETTEVVHDANGRITRMVKRVRKIFSGK